MVYLILRLRHSPTFDNSPELQYITHHTLQRVVKVTTPNSRIWMIFYTVELTS